MKKKQKNSKNENKNGMKVWDVCVLGDEYYIEIDDQYKIVRMIIIVLSFLSLLLMKKSIKLIFFVIIMHIFNIEFDIAISFE